MFDKYSYITNEKKFKKYLEIKKKINYHKNQIEKIFATPIGELFNKPKVTAKLKNRKVIIIIDNE